jgi:hypothetical protein
MLHVIRFRRVLGISAVLLAAATVSPQFSVSCLLSPAQAQDVWGVDCNQLAKTYNCQDVTGCNGKANDNCANGDCTGACNSSNSWTDLKTVTTGGSLYTVDQAGGLDCGKTYNTPGTCGKTTGPNGVCQCSSGTNPNGAACTKDTYKPAQNCPGS